MPPHSFGNPETLSPWTLDPVWSVHRQLDRMRRYHGTMLERLGAGADEAPHRIVFREEGVALRRYDAGAATGPVLLMVPAPIKTASIWDLAPRASVVRHCLKEGFRVFLIEWERTDGEGAGLSEYAGRFILRCLDAVAEETGERKAFLAGHSLGGTFCALFASLWPDRIQGLIFVGAPINLGKDAGDLAPLLMASSGSLWQAFGWPDVPGSFLSIASSLASPKTFLWERWADWLMSLPDARAREIHLRTLRWTLGEMAISRRLFQDVLELLYRENRFMSGKLEIDGRSALPERIDAPILGIVDPRCRVAPLESFMPFLDAARSEEKRVLFYDGDIGVGLQHLGMLVGKNAHRTIWPEVSRWIREQGKGS